MISVTFRIQVVLKAIYQRHASIKSLDLTRKISLQKLETRMELLPRKCKREKKSNTKTLHYYLEKVKGYRGEQQSEKK